MIDEKRDNTQTHNEWGNGGGDIYKISKIKHYLPCMIPRIDQTPCGGPSQIPKI